MNRNLFYSATLGFALGVATVAFFNFSLFTIIGLSAVGLTSLILGIFLNNKLRDWRLAVLSFGIFALAASLGAWRAGLSSGNLSGELSSRVGMEVGLRGMVDEEPDVREFHTQYTIKILLLDETEADFREKVLLFADSYPSYRYGDVLNIRGSLELPENFLTDTGREFDYVSYLAKDGIYYQINRPAIVLAASGQGKPLENFLLGVKDKFLARLEAAIPRPESALLGGLILGKKQSLGKELISDFRVSGLSHIVVLSGYNITILIQSVTKVLRFLPAAFSFGASMILIFLFVVMVGAGATVVRAAIMAALAMLAPILGRRYDLNRALFLAATLMLVHNPLILLHDISFQLSFLSTFALVNLSPHLKKFFPFVTERYALREIVASTVSTQIFVLPVLLYSMGAVSIVSLFANLLVLPFIPMTMLTGFLTGAFGFVSYFISLPAAFLSYILLSYEINIVKFFASLPGAAVSVAKFSSLALLISYLILGGLIFWLRRRKTNEQSKEF